MSRGAFRLAEPLTTADNDSEQKEGDLVLMSVFRSIKRDIDAIRDRDPAARACFEVKARNEFFDLEPILREYRRMGGSRR